MDFGLGLGRPEFGRRPDAKSMTYLVPSRGGGEIMAVVCLREEVMQRLREDEELRKYALYIG